MPRVRGEAAAALRQLGPAAKAAIPALIETLNDREPPVRVEASLALAAIGTEAVPALIKAVQGTNPFLQMGAALALGQGADDFLGTQGDPWDTQSDMFMVLLGASAALLLLSRLHDRQIAALPGPKD